jgi:hypothetical protein
MQVHPKECPSNTQVIPMAPIQLLEPSFADAIAAIEQATGLAPSKRTHWCCSLRSIAKALDRPVESIAARWVAVALQVNQLHHANSGVEWKTLANHKSNAKRALAWFSGEQGLPLRGTPLKSEWQRLSAAPEGSVSAGQAVGPDPLLQPQGDRTARGR